MTLNFIFAEEVLKFSSGKCWRIISNLELDIFISDIELDILLRQV